MKSKWLDGSLIVLAITFLFFGLQVVQLGIPGIVVLCLTVGFLLGKYFGHQKAGTYYQHGYEAGKRDAASEHIDQPAARN